MASPAEISSFACEMALRPSNALETSVRTLAAGLSVSLKHVCQLSIMVLSDA